MSEPLSLTPTAPPLDRLLIAADRLLIAADRYNRYPTEPVQLSLRVAPGAGGETLTLTLPRGLDWQPIHGGPRPPAFVEDSEAGLTAHWRMDDYVGINGPLTFRAAAQVQFLERSQDLPVTAVLRDAEGMALASTGVRIHVETQSRLMRYLPEIYHENELLGRFLMGFESFWNPIEGQVTGGEVYYDPQLAPANFLPWLASWMGAVWDESLPVERQRELLGKTLELYQKRGTRQGLEQFLRLYTGGQVKVIEHRAENLVLGPVSRMGYTHALGRQNSPNTFTVIVQVPCERLYALYGRETYRLEDLFRQRLEALIETQKPAHTAFRLQLVITDEGVPAVIREDQ